MGQKHRKKATKQIRFWPFLVIFVRFGHIFWEFVVANGQLNEGINWKRICSDLSFGIITCFPINPYYSSETNSLSAWNLSSNEVYFDKSARLGCFLWIWWSPKVQNRPKSTTSMIRTLSDPNFSKTIPSKLNGGHFWNGRFWPVWSKNKPCPAFQSI